MKLAPLAQILGSLATIALIISACDQGPDTPVNETQVPVEQALGVDDGVGNLVRLPGDKTPPDGVTFGPEILAFIVEALTVLVDDDDVFDVRALRENPGNLLTQFRLGQKDRCTGVLQPVTDGLRAKCREQGTNDAAGFERSKKREIELGQAVHKNENSVATSQS